METYFNQILFFSYTSQTHLLEIAFIFYFLFATTNTLWKQKETKCNLVYMFYEHNEEMVLDNNQQA